MQSRKSLQFFFIFVCAKVLFALGKSSSATKASFVSPATPSIVRSAPAPTEIAFARNRAVSNGYGIYSSSGSVLNAKKKNAGGAATKKGKVQVKLLKHVAGTGQAGDVIQVTPAFFNNKLRPTNSAAIISDEEVAKERAEGEEMEREINEKAKELQATLSETTLTLTRKAGPEGQLFGGIGPKVIMSELEKVNGSKFLSQKWVKISEILDENGKKMRGDIKHTGSFGARINLKKDISAKFAIEVVAGE